MKTEPVAAARSKSHIRYKTKNGELVPGVTTVLSVLNKPALVPWANNLGLQGIAVGKYVDTLATIGTIAHEMICCHLKNKKFEPAVKDSDIVDQAENSFLKYLEWEKRHKVEVFDAEFPLVSEQFKFGGTVDFYGTLDGIQCLLDFKTSKSIYPEHLYQVAAYKALLNHNAYMVDAVGILQIGRSEDEGFSERIISDCSREWEIFKHCLAIYQLKKSGG